MKFPFDKEAYKLFDNLFAFFGVVDCYGSVISLEGKILENSGVELLLSQNRKFSEMFFWQTSEQNVRKLENALIEATANNFKEHLDFKINADKNIPLCLNLHPVFNEEDNSNYIFFSAREVDRHDTAVQEDLQDSYLPDERTEREIEKVRRDKDFFIAFLSHELRSPLNTILGWTKILLTKEINDAVKKNALETIEKSARLQAKMIDDLVDSARVTSGKISLELIQLNFFDVLESVYNSQKSLVEAKNIDLEFICGNKDIPVFGDVSRLKQVITILVSNALKSVSAGGHIKIAVEIKDNEIITTIEDDGRGIALEQASGIFKQFQNGDEKKSFNSSVIEMELSVVKSLTEKHNGRVEAKSAGVGFGSTFALYLPLAKPARKINVMTEKFLDDESQFIGLN